MVSFIEAMVIAREWRLTYAVIPLKCTAQSRPYRRKMLIIGDITGAAHRLGVECFDGDEREHYAGGVSRELLNAELRALQNRTHRPAFLLKLLIPSH